MLTERDTIFASAVLAVVGTFITIARKYHLSKIGVTAVTILDIAMTNIILISFIFATTPMSKLTDTFIKLTPFDYISAMIVSSLIAISIIIGRTLLLNNDISSLAIIHTVIDILLSVILGNLIYNEKITKNKAIGIGLIIVGSLFIHL